MITIQARQIIDCSPADMLEFVMDIERYQQVDRKIRPVIWARRDGEVTEFAAGLAADGVPQDIIDFLVDLFGTVLDGRNAVVGDGVERVLGRPARDFADYARATAASGVWNPTDQPNPESPR